MSETIEITKAEANPAVESARVSKSEIGNPFLKAQGSWIQQEMRRELQPPYNLITYEKMRQDATVAAALSTAEAFLTKALANAKFVTNSKNQESKDFCDFLNWNLKNLKETTWYDASVNILSYLQYGFSFVEKVYEPNTSSKHSKYAWKLKKLAPRSQHSIAEWKFDDEGRNVVGLRQWPAQSLNLGYTRSSILPSSEYKMIKRNKFMLFSWDSKNGSPVGTSPLNACYRAWKEKTLIESIEVTGISKGLNGIVKATCPAEVINKAAEDPESNEAALLQALQQQLALMHQGDQTYVLMASDPHEGTNIPLYNFELKGVDGQGGKTVTTVEFIEARKKAILDTFGAGFINLGNDNTGSYSLADAKTSLHAFFMEKHMIFIQSVIQNDLVKQMLEINGLTSMREEDIPQFRLNALDEVNPEEYSKSAQRLAATGILPRKKEFLMDVLSKCGWNVESLLDLTEEELLESLANPNDTSRVGDGMAQGMPSGTGNANGNNSAINMDNKA